MDNIGKRIVEIRPAKLSELEYIAQNNEGNVSPKAFIKYLRCAHEMEPHHVLVAVVDGELAGHLVAISNCGRFMLKLIMNGGLLILMRGAVSRPPLDPHLLHGAQLGPLTVYPPYRGMGLPRLLVLRMVSDLQSNQIRFWTKETNATIHMMVRRMAKGKGVCYKEKRCSGGWIRYELRWDAKLVPDLVH